MSHEQPQPHHPLPATFVNGFEPLPGVSERRGLYYHPDHDVVARAYGYQADKQATGLIEQGALFERALEDYSAATGIHVVEHQLVVTEGIDPITKEPEPMLTVASEHLEPIVTFDQALDQQRYLAAFDAAAARIVVYTKHLMEQGGTVDFDTLSLGQLVVEEDSGRVTLIDVGPQHATEARPITGQQSEGYMPEYLYFSHLVASLRHEITALATQMGGHEHSLAAEKFQQLEDFLAQQGLAELFDEAEWD